MNIKELQASLRHFAAERDWQPFHSPKNLTTALMVEAGELAEIFQWLTEEESRQAHADPDLKARIEEETADVLLYLLQVADLSKVDLLRAAHEKMAHNAIKYPPKRRIEFASAASVRPAETHVLLDYESVQPSDDELRVLVPDVSDAWVFHGPHQKNVEARFASFGNQAVLVPINRPGKNALDFHLSYYMGYITSRNPAARFVVVANDKGYDSMLDHAKELGFTVERRAFGREPSHASAATVVAPSPSTQPAAPAQKVAAPLQAPAKKAAASKSTAAKKQPAKAQPANKSSPQPAKKAPPPKPAATKSASKTAAAPPARKSKSDSAPSHAKIVASLKKMGGKRPAKMPSLQRTVQMLLGQSAKGEALTAAINKLIASGSVSVGQAGVLNYKF